MIKTRATSIRFRLTASYTAVLAFTLCLSGIGVWLALHQSIRKTADRELQSRLAEIRRYVEGFSARDLSHLEAEFREESLLNQSTTTIRISDSQGHLLFRTAGTEDWPPAFAASSLQSEGRYRTVRIRGEMVRVLTAPVRVGMVEIGLPLEAFEEVQSGFLWLLGLGSPFLLFIAGLGGYWMSGRALKPVDAISHSAAQISAHHLSARLPSRGVGDELDRLSGVLNDMLARLESAFLRITGFTADASHELRTPVAVMQTTAELMQTKPRTLAEHVEAWQKITTETERTSRLLEDLLMLARSDAGAVALDMRPLDLAETARTAVEEMRVMAEAKGVALHVETEACTVRGDADALRRCFCILLDNAIKFTAAAGHIAVSVRPGTRATVKVVDTGIGIGPDDLPLVFERFYRASKDRSRQTGGAGLGLSIARWIVEQHGGKIEATSTPGQGSLFAVSFPLA